MKLPFSFPSAALAIGLSFLAISPAEATYTFTKVADTTDDRLGALTGRARYFTAPLLNNVGTVLFSGGQFSGEVQFVFTGDGNTITTIATPALVPPSALPQSNQYPIVFGTAINDNGAVAVITRRRTASNELTDFLGLFISDGETITPIVERSNTSTATNDGFFSASINNNGTVAFNTTRLITNDRVIAAGIYTSREGSLTPINLPGIQPVSAPINNDDETLVFQGREQVAAGITNLYSLNGETLTRLLTNDPAQNPNPFSTLNSISLNNRGTVALLVTPRSGNPQFLTINADGTQTVVAEARFSGGQLFSRLTAIAINNTDDVALVAEPTGQPATLLKGADPETDKVLAVGDELFDSTVKTIAISPKAINDAGQIAFLVGLTDGRSVIVRAEPEPALAPTELGDSELVVEQPESR
jgi:hypothetical protein